MGTCKMIRKRVPKTEIVIDLDGPDGNANNLMGLAIRFCRASRMVEEEIKPIETSQKHIKKKIGRNEPCFCGSGKKYKHCCGAL